MFPDTFADLPQLAPSLEAACRALQARRPVRFKTAIDEMLRLVFTTQSACIVHQYAPEKLLDACSAPDGIILSDVLAHPYEVYPIESAAFRILEGLFPIDSFNLEEGMFNLEDIGDMPCLVPMPQGWPYSFDEMSESASNPENYSPSESLLVFADYLSWRIEQDYWVVAAERFGWPDRIPECILRNEHG
ncbi:MAG: hypothetical protein C4575_12745, partial [Desulforudis sp.]